MKNIHVLSTDKPSRLSILNNGKLNFGAEIMSSFNSKPQNIYITSDEEIKEDYVIAYGVVIKVMMFDKETLYFVNGTKAKKEDCKKIILTTDQDLIKDGVQAIDDEFLEWFVKNPSCEVVEVEKDYSYGNLEHFDYKIIIPKTTQQVIDEDFAGGLDMGQIIPKQETLEEAAKGYSERHQDVSGNLGKYLVSAVFQDGAKWQQEETIKEVFEWLTTHNYLTDLKETLIEQFKKK